jgi:hypothetical protein
MATSPLFGWEEPDDTDLVKDGAAAIRTLGNAIDTSMGDLLGGTTGQVLSKASNTNMDFTWVTSDDANAIQNTIVDAKGDLIAASASDTPARLAVGNNGETLVADSSTSTGLRYTAGTVQTNPVLNASAQIWQRGTSFTPATGTITYTADRWSTYRAVANYTISRQLTNDSINLPNIQYCIRSQRNSTTTNTDQIWLYQSFETVNSIPYAGKTVTISFYARAGANYSMASSALNIRLAQGTGTDQNWIAGYTGVTNVIDSNVTLTTTWQRFTATGTVSATATELTTAFTFVPVGTAGAADFFETTGMQIDIGSVALPFRNNAATIQGELAACQRYYQQYAGGLGVPYNGVANSATTLMTYLAIQPTMRTAATCTVGGTLYADDGYSSTVNAASPTVDFVDQYQGGGRFRIGGFSGMTTGRHYSFYYNTGYIGLSAEL